MEQAGAAPTGAAPTEIAGEVASCLARSRADDGQAAREFRGVKLECSTLADGGGQISLYRRFGVAPLIANLTPTARAAVEQASAMARSAEAQRSADALRFARWWQDATISKNVKTSALLIARRVALAERCPGDSLDDRTIEELARNAGISVSDVQENGRYAPLMAELLASMRAGTATESVAAACQELAQVGHRPDSDPQRGLP